MSAVLKYREDIPDDRESHDIYSDMVDQTVKLRNEIRTLKERNEQLEKEVETLRKENFQFRQEICLLEAMWDTQD